MINVTMHAYKRYSERIKLVDKEEILSDITTNKDQYHTELNKMFQNSRLIYTGRFNDKHNETNFRIADNIILITDKMDTKIITLYRVEFGFDREVDMTILRSLISKLNVAEESYLVAMDEVREEKERVIANKHFIELEIEAMEENLKAMKESLAVANEYIDNFTYRERVAKVDMDTLAKQIVYSNIYRKEMSEVM